jgi:hypothetical protein
MKNERIHVRIIILAKKCIKNHAILLGTQKNIIGKGD